MAETITIPSPSFFLNGADAGPVAPDQLPKSARSPPAKSKDGLKASETSGITKRKQSKSRNGCITCKAKRLKCDETKPTCQQCARRAVTCGGYKKDYKWRPFEETTITAKGPVKPKKGSSPPTVPPALASVPVVGPNPSHVITNNEPFDFAYYHPHRPQTTVHGAPPMPMHTEPLFAMTTAYPIPYNSPYMFAPPPISPVESFPSGSAESRSSVFGAESIDTCLVKTTAPSSVSSGQSPRLLDLLLPGTDLNVPPEEYMSFREQHEAFYQPTGLTPPADELDPDVEEIPRNFDTNQDLWSISPPHSNTSKSSSDLPVYPFFKQPESPLAEKLARHWDRETCGVLSLKDGPTENPWRTLIWPLSRECPALYYAITSMTSFHQSRDTPSLRIHGIENMHKAVLDLASGMEKMRVDAAISTTLALAFSESWDQHIRTGINHIKGAKILIDRALVQHNQNPMRGDDLARMKFLCNSWVYMDVIARLTSADGDESSNYDNIFEHLNAGAETDAQLDPLMGCAGTLFPIIGRVANLVRKVRRIDDNSPTIISHAIELKRQLEDWMPPSYIEDPEDETTSPHDSIKTATAYQYATLLYLHQAVPEIPSLPSLALAKKILCELATVHPTSRSTIVHIYPLMAAGCEMIEESDREWVRDRWHMMSKRMKLGILEKCQEVTKEVWCRRDAYAEARLGEPDWVPDMDITMPILKREFSAMSDEFEPDGEYCWLEHSSKRRALEGTTVCDGLRSVPIKTEPDCGVSWVEPNAKRGPLESTTIYEASRPVPIKTEPGCGVRRLDVAGTEHLEVEFTVKGRLHWLGVMKDWEWEVLLG